MNVLRPVFLFLLCLPGMGLAQDLTIKGHVADASGPVPYANVLLQGTSLGTTTDEKGMFRLSGLQAGSYTLVVSSLGYRTYRKPVKLGPAPLTDLHITLQPGMESLDEMVVTGTLKAVSRTDTPVPVEVYSPAFFKKNPTANVFEALQNVNGVRPQINCNVCNTGDIHINGLEGPYTLVLIDGMPIVSGLGTVYGLTGIPNSLATCADPLGVNSAIYTLQAPEGPH